VRAVAARGQGVGMLGAAKRIVDGLVGNDLVKARDHRCSGETPRQKPASADLERALVFLV